MESAVPPSDEGNHASGTRVGRFNTTHWSAVLNAANGNERALQELCETYWYPLYAFVRSEGHSPADSEDLVQTFFAGLLKDRERKLQSVDRAKGKFRSFLLAALKNSSRDMRDRKMAEKRGGKAVFVPIDLATAEDQYRHEPTDCHSPDRMYDRRWARAILDASLKALAREMIEAGQRERYAALKIFLGAKMPGKSHAEVAAEFGTTEGIIRNAVQRLRARYGELIRKQIADTLSNPTRTAVDQELAYLMEILED